MSTGLMILVGFSAGFPAGILGAYWWLSGYQRGINDRLRALENEVLDDTREHWIQGVQTGEKDWNWPGRTYGGTD